MTNVLATLRNRGLLQDVTDPGLEQLLERERLTVYVGFDPSADSLHIGNLIGIIVLRHFQLAGHRPIALVGGATGMIGDPSGKSAERSLLTPEQIAHNLDGIRADLARVLDFHGDNPALLVNNADWTAPATFIEFLRDVGKHFRVSEMLARDSVRNRLESESGLSFTEFAYMLLQANDFRHLHATHGCRVQSGGSDQWGNIVSGVDLIRRTTGEQAYGMTTPLLTDSQGRKMGKTAGGAIWLNPDKLSPYDFYQFWVRQEDDQVGSLLRKVTFLPLEEIEAILADHAKDPGARRAQAALAHAVTSLVHGKDEADRARDSAAALFGGALENQSDADLERLFGDVPSVELPRADLEARLPAPDLLVRSGLAQSKGDAKRLLKQGGVYLNNGRDPVSPDQRDFGPEHLASQNLLLLRAGKKNYRLVRFH